MILNWLSIVASLLMGIGGLLLFIQAVRCDYFRNIEEARYQVFWSDVGELLASSEAFSSAENDERAMNRPAADLCADACTLRFQEDSFQEDAGKSQAEGGAVK